MNNEEKTYKQAYQELQNILKDLENNETDVDVLSEKLQQANELIEYCKQRLAKIEVDVDKLIKEIEAL
ncbi:MAG: exodeoxyribonuclease VII small subunit [Synergistales bacterium]|nr:exodeoxyribonuclease VII small subunit [Bacteroidales bacterium]MDY6435814.1 exodeoxyribonuclease VII small subunit [Synergistales bacterium]MDY6380622.1 exodeoxyribonuclease VII small subunit [Bacteroidales bacterium]MDY6393255.1 exodeoxyribonuclease VII small subunit [Bacteroidales bacterium]MDY6395638.1 exodeoxyribonuclease VII small subunit [Bacteroidales bacterium]